MSNPGVPNLFQRLEDCQDEEGTRRHEEFLKHGLGLPENAIATIMRLSKEGRATLEQAVLDGHDELNMEQRALLLAGQIISLNDCGSGSHEMLTGLIISGNRAMAEKLAKLGLFPYRNKFRELIGFTQKEKIANKPGCTLVPIDEAFHQPTETNNAA